MEEHDWMLINEALESYKRQLAESELQEVEAMDLGSQVRVYGTLHAIVSEQTRITNLLQA
jgi:hypothetical protein